MMEIKDSMDFTADPSKFKQKVCTFWLEGTCKFSDEDCKYLHANDQDKLPVCKYYMEHGHCSKQETCRYKHPTGKTDSTNMPSGGANEPCPYYERGYFSKGYACRWAVQHTFAMLRKQTFPGGGSICLDYNLGFCPKGPNCKFEHLKSVISDEQTSLSSLANFP